MLLAQTGYHDEEMEGSNGDGLPKSNRTNNHHLGGTFYIAGTLLASSHTSLPLLSVTSLSGGT